MMSTFLDIRQDYLVSRIRLLIYIIKIIVEYIDLNRLISIYLYVPYIGGSQTDVMNIPVCLTSWFSFCKGKLLDRFLVNDFVIVYIHKKAFNNIELSSVIVKQNGRHSKTWFQLFGCVFCSLYRKTAFLWSS